MNLILTLTVILAVGCGLKSDRTNPRVLRQATQKFSVEKKTTDESNIATSGSILGSVAIDAQGLVRADISSIPAISEMYYSINSISNPWVFVQAFPDAQKKLEIEFTLQDVYRNGEENLLIVFLKNSQEELFIVGSKPVKFQAQSRWQDGQEFYSAVVSPQINFYCSFCHENSYERDYKYLSLPSLEEGGTPDSNALIFFPSGDNGHPGGRVCRTQDSSPCREMRLWWQVEFGSAKSFP